ncbi:hypothetical protein PCANC_02375 [Puccinia coronata f. sp. avenae]|uniref:Leucine carboxyl methyltransferase 1 n=1 Tax=Puccinia coronata f. sp. avenae TaxID=200324 RepID=A0A2N5VZA2_9BASI|nr:hypothetical protein PCASD_00083 [Puccinia coronata f. sp. avenae]PLW55323.1 hypothetical protein PCANC_02375 [Puccinia coronata f. sp. avenae]
MSIPPFFNRGTGTTSTLTGKGRLSSRDPDRAVRETDLDAAAARVSAISKNYLHDRFAGLLTRPSHAGEGSTLRPPWVNIGTHHRTYVIDSLTERFMVGGQGAKKKQVLSLGAGSDSRFWRLRERYCTTGEAWPVGRWVETDLQMTVGQKIRSVLANDSLRALCGPQLAVSPGPELPVGAPAPYIDLPSDPTDLYADNYCLLSADLRRPAELIDKLQSVPPTGSSKDPLLDPAAPTLIIAELLFLYLSPSHTAACLAALTAFFKGPLMIITYEALDLGDSFSRMMVQNLAGRGLSLAGFECNRSVASQIARLEEHGFTEIVSTDMKSLRVGVATAEEGRGEEWKTRWEGELERIRRLEFLDEVEELELILQHYAVSWATRNPHSPARSTVGFYLPTF